MKLSSSSRISRNFSLDNFLLYLEIMQIRNRRKEVEKYRKDNCNMRKIPKLIRQCIHRKVGASIDYTRGTDVHV